MITFAICEDEPHMARELSDRLAACLEERQISAYRVSSFSDGASLLAQSGSFDIIFLDVRMKQPDGMETARLLRRRGDHSLLIFVTALREYVFEAFQVEAFDYLLKPLEAGCLQRTVDRALEALEQRRAKSVVIRRGGACEVLSLAEIAYCEVQGRRIYIHKTDGIVLDYCGRLEELERRVDGRFFKCHRSYLVNLDCVRGCQAGQVMLSGAGGSIPVSRLRERELLQALLRHMREGI